MPTVPKPPKPRPRPRPKPKPTQEPAEPAELLTKKGKPRKPHVTPVRKGQHKVSRERMIQALKDSHGIKTVAARRVGMHRFTVARWLKDDPELAAAVTEIEDEFTDEVEDAFYKQIKDGDQKAILYYLQTKGKNRGYTTRVEQTGPDGRPMQHEMLEDHSTETVLAAIERIAGKLPTLDLSPPTNGAGNGHVNGNGHG